MLFWKILYCQLYYRRFYIKFMVGKPCGLIFSTLFQRDNNISKTVSDRPRSCWIYTAIQKCFFKTLMLTVCSAKSPVLRRAFVNYLSLMVISGPNQFLTRVGSQGLWMGENSTIWLDIEGSLRPRLLNFVQQKSWFSYLCDLTPQALQQFCFMSF